MPRALLTRERESSKESKTPAQAFSSFVTSTTQDGIKNKATHSGGVLGSYRYFFGAHHGVEANYGYSLNTQSYTSAAGAIGVKSYSRSQVPKSRAWIGGPDIAH